MTDTAEIAELDEALQRALEAASQRPDEPSCWDELETVAADQQTPEPVADLFAGVLKRGLDRSLTRELGQRAMRFCEEWFGDDAEHLQKVLSAVFELDPTDVEVLERVTMGLTASGRWDELLAVYDRAVDAAQSLERQAQLLDDAARVAKDFADNTDRAIGYLERLAPLRPSDAQLRASLERLLERGERWQQLIQLWDAGLAGQSDAEQADTRVKIATCWLERMHNPPAAVDVLGQVLSGHGAHEGACELLERVLEMDSASAAARRRALTLLSDTYGAAERKLDVARVLRLGLKFAQGEERESLHRQVADILLPEGKGAEALDELGGLFSMRPADNDLGEEIRELATQLHAHAQHVSILVRAAENANDGALAANLRLQAARVAKQPLGDVDRARELFAEVFALDVDRELRLEAGRALAELLREHGERDSHVAALEHLAGLETDDDRKREVLGQLASLYASGEQVSQAVHTWRRRLEADPSDREALDGLVSLHEQQGQWSELVAVLTQRSGLLEGDEARADLGRIAEVQAEKMGDLEAALATWTQLAEQTSDGSQLGVTDLLNRAAEREAERGARVLAALGDAYRTLVGEPSRALGYYSRALAADPARAQARAGLTEMLENEEVRAGAAEILATAYNTTEEYDQWVQLLPHRLSGLGQAGPRAQLLREAAALEEQRLERPAEAFEHLCAALEVQPQDASIDADLWRLVEQVDDWQRLVNALAEAVSGIDTSHPRFAQLRTQVGEVYEHRLKDADNALESYLAAAKAQPGDVHVAQAVCRVAVASGKFEQAFRAIASVAHVEERVPDELLEGLEKSATESDAWAELCKAAEAVLEGDELSPAIKRLLLTRVAEWYEQKAEDQDAAQRLLLQASQLGGAHADTLRRLVALLRRSPGRELYDGLLAVAAFSDKDLDPLREASSVALETLEDPELAEPVLQKLLAGASTAVRQGVVLEGEHSAEECVLFAVEALAALARERGEAQRELGLLREGATLASSSERGKALAHRAAQVARDELSDRSLAISLYRNLLDESPDDELALSAVAELYEAEGRLSELLVLRRRELDLCQSVPRRLELRMSVSRLMGELEASGGRVGALQENLRESPGHLPSVDGLETILRGRGALTELGQLFFDQAAQLEAVGDAPGSARLWNRAAGLYREELKDLDRALIAYGKSTDLEVTPQALDALASIHTERGESKAAVRWLETLLTHTPAEDSVGVRLRLARAHQDSGDTARAVDVLAAGVAANPAAFELRDFLAELYRSSERWEQLAHLLLDAAEQVPDKGTMLTYAREAAQLFADQLGAPERAVDVLARAVDADPGDRMLKCLLADAQRAAGRLDQARDLLDQMIQEFGRRRSPERAEVHLRLSRVAKAAGDSEEALAQLDLAAGMDRGHLDILRELGELAQESGQLDRAERAYRSLLLLVKRQPDDKPNRIGAAEVQYALHLIALERGQSEKATELLDSALQTAVHSQRETDSLKRRLLERGEPDLLLRVLEARLEIINDGPTEALVLSDLAQLQEEALDRPDEALSTRLRALAASPQSAELHDAAVELAGKLDRVGEYVDAVDRLTERARRKEDRALSSALSLRAGSILEHSMGDAERAQAQYRQIDEAAPGYVEAQFALARIAGKLGDQDDERAVLARIVELPEDPANEAGRRGARYRLIALELRNEDTASGGLDQLEALLDRDPDAGQAVEILLDFTQRVSGHGRALELLERVARQSGDAAILLKFLERHAQGDDPSLGLVREGVELSRQLGDADRTRALLERAVVIAEQGEGLVDALWAVVDLAGLCEHEGDLAGAMNWLERAMEVSDAGEAFDLGLRLATLAASAGNDRERAIRVYETLREQEPSDRNIWQPLLGLYRDNKDLPAAEQLVRSTLEALLDPQERNALRMETAHMLFEAGREDDGAALLQDVLGEDPDHQDATLRLADLYEKRGEGEALADLLSRKLDSALERGSESIIPLSLKMGGLLAETRPSDAVDVYRQALNVAPSDVGLLRAVIDGMADEGDAADRAVYVERLLELDPGEDALGLALWLIDHRTTHQDEEGMERALALAYQVAPGHEAVRGRLENWYRERNDFPKLAEMLVEESDRSKDPQRKLDLLLEAVDIFMNKLSEPSSAAALMRKARELNPRDFELLRRAVAASAAAGELGPALAEIDAALAGVKRKADQVRLRLLRAEVSQSAGVHDDAVADLELAYEVAGDKVAPSLVDGLQQALKASAMRGNRDRERELSLRLVDILKSLGEMERARDVLTEWVDGSPNDLQPLTQLVELQSQTGQWAEALRSAHTLIGIADADALVPFAKVLVEAAKQIEQPQAARAGLEQALSRAPQYPELTDMLGELYEAAGDHKELAGLLQARLSPDLPPQQRFEALRKIGQLLLNAGETQAALKPLTEALEINPSDHATTVFIADAHIEARRLQEAQDLLERSMAGYRQRRSPELAQLRHRMARLSAVAGDDEARLEWLGVALEADMNNGAVASELALMAQGMGQHDLALKALRAITMIKGECPMSRAEAFLRQAQIVSQKGETRRAVLWAKKAKAEDPNLEGVDALLAQLEGR